jgi:hypothetical protein
VADGSEQVFLRNRRSFGAVLKSFKDAFYEWNAARNAIEEAGVSAPVFDTLMPRFSYVCSGSVPEPDVLQNLLGRVRRDSTTHIIPFDAGWASALYNNKLLSVEPGFSACRFYGSWSGNGWVRIT